MRALLDCDVVVDVGIARKPWVQHSRAVLDWCEQNPGSGLVASHTIPTAYYLMRKERDEAAKRLFMQDLLAFVAVAPIGTLEAKLALSLPMHDFEDALQAAAAVAARADYIVTRNASHFRHSPIPALTPADFMTLLAR